MDSKRKEEITAIYDRLYTLLHKKKIDRKVVKRLLYDDKETHKRLGISESTLNTMWDRLCIGSQNPPRIDGIVIIKDTPFEVIKLEKSKKPKQANKGGGKVATQVIQYNPETNKEVRRFKSAVACAEELGLKIGTVRNILYGITNNPKAHIRYAEISEQKVDISEQKVDISEQKPKRKYNKKVTIATVVPKGQELEVAKVLEEKTKESQVRKWDDEQKAFVLCPKVEINTSLKNTEIADELPDGYEELRETPLEKKDEQNPFETAPDPEQRHIVAEYKIRFSADSSLLDVLREEYLRELKNHIDNEVLKLKIKIVGDETVLVNKGIKKTI